MNGFDMNKFDNKRILPRDIPKMGGEKEVIVNRIQINTRLIEIEAGVSPNHEKLTSLRKAVDDIKRVDVDKEKRSAALGAKMQVKDILNVFDDVTKMPNNSFERI